MPQKNEVVLKENRHEDGSRNQNGRLYKDRSQDADLGSGAAQARQLIMPFLLALFVLLASKVSCCLANGNAPASTGLGNDSMRVAESTATTRTMAEANGGGGVAGGSCKARFIL